MVPPPAGEVSHREALRRKEAALAQLRELELAKARGDLVEVAAVKRELTAIGAEVWSNLERLADTLPLQLAAAADAHAIGEILEVELRRIATEMSTQIAGALPAQPVGETHVETP